MLSKVITFRLHLIVGKETSNVFHASKTVATQLNLMFWIAVQVITQFLKLETLLDDSVNQKIELQIERGGTQLTVNLTVRVFLVWYYVLLWKSLVCMSGKFIAVAINWCTA